MSFTFVKRIVVSLFIGGVVFASHFDRVSPVAAGNSRLTDLSELFDIPAADLSLLVAR